MKKMKFAILPLIVIPFLTSCGNKEPTSFTISTTTTGVKITPNTASKNQDYSGTISVTEDGTFLPDELDYVKLKSSETSIIKDCTYTRASDALTATFTVPAQDVTDNIVVGITLDETTKWFVSFNTDGGSFIKSQRVEDGKMASRPTNPTKEDYVFAGWYKDGETTEFDFDHTPINQNTVLKAKWTGGPQPISYHFKFNGTYCAVNGSNRYEADVLIDAQTQFAIVPNAGYAYPKNDGTHFVVTGKGKDNVTYDATTGIISIGKMTGDINIIAQSDITDVYMFAFSGTNCTINNAEQFAKGLIKKGSNLQFTIVPKDGYDLPTAGVEEQIKITGEHVSYANGIITINEMVSNVLVVANAPESSREKPDCTVIFHSDVCKANTQDTVEGAKHNLFVTRESEEDSLTLYLFPDDVSYLFPDEVSVTFEDTQCQEGDYIYNKAEKTITIVKKANAMISLEKMMHTLTFNAGDGTFNGKKTISVNVPNGTNLSNFLRFMTAVPTLKDKTFAYYDKDDIFPNVQYDDVVTEDITLTASYFNTATPYDDLDEVLWSSIQRVAITNPNPASCFNVGATKTVDINNHQQKVRIIGFNHDVLANDENDVPVGITFEFVNLFSSLDGNAVTTCWNNKDGSTSTNHDFPHSTLNETLDNIYLAFPDYLTDVIVDVTKYCGTKVTGTSFTAEPYVTKLFPLSYEEVTSNEAEGVTKGEGTVYEYYRQHPEFESFLKTDMNNNALYYWYRSPYTKDDRHAWYLDHFALLYHEEIDHAFAVAPAFCI